MAFIDQGEFEAMKSLSGWEAVRSDEHQFRAKIKVNTISISEAASPVRADFFFGRGSRTWSPNGGKLMTGLYPFCSYT